MEKPPFAKTHVAVDPVTGDEISFMAINLLDQFIINVQINGTMDTTFNIPMSTGSTVRQTGGGDLDSDLGIEPVVLMGQNTTKMNVIATQIGKLVQMKGKGLILSIGSRWFGSGEDVDKNDFHKLTFVLEGIKRVI